MHMLEDKLSHSTCIICKVNMSNDFHVTLSFVCPNVVLFVSRNVQYLIKKKST